MAIKSDVRTEENLIQVVRDDGTVLDKKLEPEIGEADLKRLYYHMVLTRAVDDRLLRMQRQGRVGFYISSLGEEAAHLGSAFALKTEDWIFPQYREPGAAFLRGYPLLKYVCQILGNSGDLMKGRQMPNHYAYKPGRYLSVSSPVGTQIPQAAGFAWGAKIRKEKIVTLVYFGDGATSQGDFHMGLNFAGVFTLPTIFFCKNNQWAISVPLSRQTAVPTIAQKAAAYGIRGVRVDGNDLLAVVQVTREAAERAREGEGATLIEAVTYRMGAHSTSDDPRIYADESKIEQWKPKDPLVRFQKYLAVKGIWNAAFEKEMTEKVQEEVTKAIQEAEKLPSPAPETLFDDVYAELLPHLKEQREEAAQFKHLGKHKE